MLLVGWTFIYGGLYESTNLNESLNSGKLTWQQKMHLLLRMIEQLLVISIAILVNQSLRFCNVQDTQFKMPFLRFRRFGGFKTFAMKGFCDKWFERC